MVTEEKREYYREYQRTHREHRKKWEEAYYLKNKDALNKLGKEYNLLTMDQRHHLDAQYRWQVMEIIAEYRGYERPECMIGMTPDATIDEVQLINLPHAGHLEIDHIEGLAGTGRSKLKGKTHGQELIGRILNGEQDISELRLLCVLHNRLYKSKNFASYSDYNQRRPGSDARRVHVRGHRRRA